MKQCALYAHTGTNTTAPVEAIDLENVAYIIVYLGMHEGVAVAGAGDARVSNVVSGGAKRI